MTHTAAIGMHAGSPVVRVTPDGSSTPEAMYPVTAGPSDVVSDAATFVLDDEGWQITGWWSVAGTVTVTRKDTP